MKILTNKQYRDLLLKSTRGMFGAVTDDMLLRNNAFINEENRELQERIDKAIEYIENNIENWENSPEILSGYDEDKMILEILKEEDNG